MIEVFALASVIMMFAGCGSKNTATAPIHTTSTHKESVVSIKPEVENIDVYAAMEELEEIAQSDGETFFSNLERMIELLMVIGGYDNPQKDETELPSRKMRQEIIDSLENFEQR
jgi:hypothetical protein